MSRLNPVYRSTLAHHRAWFDRTAAANESDAAWLVALRADAMAGFEEQGFPHPRLEEWRYTNVAAVARLAFEPVSAAPTEVHAPGAGVSVTTLAEARRSDPDKLRELVERAPAAKDRSFALLNTAFFDDGAIVEIAPETSVKETIHLRFEASAGEAAAVRHPRVIVTAQPGAQAVLVISFDAVASASGALMNTLVDVHVGANASLSLVLVQREQAGTFHVSNTSAQVERDGRLAVHTVTLGGELVRNDLDVVLADVGAECDLRGLFIGQGEGVIDNHSSVDHAMPHGTSRELYKGILADASRGVFRGRVIVRPDAQKTDATQSNPNLLLGERAEIDTKPQLEIYADDVKCAHGATIGQLDPEALFYLKSRGLDEPTGRTMLTRAFAAEITDALPDEALATELGQAIDEALGTVLDKEAAQ